MLVVLRILAALILLTLLLSVIGIIIPLKFVRLSRGGAGILMLIALVAAVGLSLYAVHIAPTIAAVSPDRRSNDLARAKTANSPISRVLNTQSDFEHSEFCQSYHCKEDKHWPVRNGDVNHSYDTTVNDLMVEIEDNSTRNPKVTGFGMIFLGRDQLSPEDFNTIAILVRGIDQSANHDKTISFIKGNIENEISCRTCQLNESTNFVTDGDFRVWAGKVGSDQTISSKRVF